MALGAMKLNPTISFGNLIELAVILVALIAGWFAFENKIAMASDDAKDAQESSRQNTQDIRDLTKSIVKLTEGVTVMSETVKRQSEIQALKFMFVDERLKGLKATVDKSGPN